MELNREQIIKELEGLVKFITCPEYVQKAFALIIELTNENKNLFARNLELTEDVEEWKALAEDYKNRFVDCRNEKAKLTEENERLRCENKTLTYNYEELKSQIKEPFITEEECPDCQHFVGCDSYGIVCEKYRAEND